jgi:uncharacterized membrane protein YsdA (DUF1294 family)
VKLLQSTNLVLIAGACIGLMSLVTFLAFAWDKRRAIRFGGGDEARARGRAGTGGRDRVPERTLHILELLGGWPGAIAAMAILRHKNRKGRYWLVTALIAAVHIALAMLFIARSAH